jgi:predicted dehydrogenase
MGENLKLTSGAGAPMQGFVSPKLDRVRVGIVGLGARGWVALPRLQKVPGLEITALCEVREPQLERAYRHCKSSGAADVKLFRGDEGYKGLCDCPDVDVVYNCTPWHLHAPVSVYAMEAGKHVMIEVPAAMRLEECWQLVETAEATRRHCMQLENCCYGEYELLFLNLCRKGLLGELIHGEGAYIHDRRWQIFNDSQWQRWRSRWNQEHCGNQYSTHGLGPVCQYMNINRGDRLDYLVSTDSRQVGYERYAEGTLPAGDSRRKTRFAMSDMNVTTIRTVLGRTIMLQHDVSSPRPYSRLNLIAGTNGVARSYPRLDIMLENRYPRSARECHHEFNAEETERLRLEHMHPMWKVAGELAKKVGGHGGMDYLMDLRWVHCLRNGLPLDTDVYDLAAWCSVNELSERSARNRSSSENIPDFTDGGWRDAKPLDIVTVPV